MIIRVSCLVVASVAAFSFSQINIGSYRKQNSRIEVSGAYEVLFLSCITCIPFFAYAFVLILILLS
jgi:hypothetical protein